MAKKVMVINNVDHGLIDAFTGEQRMKGDAYEMDKNQADFMIAEGTVILAPEGTKSSGAAAPVDPLAKDPHGVKK